MGTVNSLDKARERRKEKIAKTFLRSRFFLRSQIQLDNAAMKASKEKLPEPVTNGKPVIDPNIFWDKSQMARVLQTSIGTINNRMSDGSLCYLKLGRRVLFHRETVLAQLVRAQRGGVQ